MLKHFANRVALPNSTSANVSTNVQFNRTISLVRTAPISPFILRTSRQQRVSFGSVPTFKSSSSFNLNSRQSLFKDSIELDISRGFASNLPPHTEVGLPALSPSMERGNIAKWKKKEGDKIKATDVIAEIETDKATVDFEATEDVYLAKILFPDGSKDIPVGTPIAIVVEKQEDVQAFKDYKGAAPQAAPQEAPQKPQPKKETTPQPQTAPKAAPPPTPEPVRSGKWVPGAPPPLRPGGASDLAKATASSRSIDVNSIQGTGPAGRVIVADVLEQKARAPVVSAPGGTAQYTDIPNSQIRKVIADRLTQSKQTIPHYYLTIDCRIDELSKLRAKLNDKGKGEYKLSVNDFVVKASALALRKVPEANSSWLGESIRRYSNVDINVAVNTDRGLMTPLIKDADKIGLVSINHAVKDMAERAKIGKLTPTELSSGTFTISNLGMFGIKHFSAVINPPQACILAVGSSEKRVVQNEEGGKENPYTVAEYISVTLSCDHRVVDGAVGAQWLQKFREYLEDPTKMLL